MPGLRHLKNTGYAKGTPWRALISGLTASRQAACLEAVTGADAQYRVRLEILDLVGQFFVFSGNVRFQGGACQWVAAGIAQRGFRRALEQYADIAGNAPASFFHRITPADADVGRDLAEIDGAVQLARAGCRVGVAVQCVAAVFVRLAFGIDFVAVVHDAGADAEGAVHGEVVEQGVNGAQLELQLVVDIVGAGIVGVVQEADAKTGIQVRLQRHAQVRADASRAQVGRDGHFCLGLACAEHACQQGGDQVLLFHAYGLQLLVKPRDKCANRKLKFLIGNFCKDDRGWNGARQDWQYKVLLSRRKTLYLFTSPT